MKIDLNSNWTFYKNNQMVGTVNLPHDSMIIEKRYQTSRTGVAGAYFSGGFYTYKKTLQIPENWLGKSLTLQFEGVYQNATVSLNGKKLAFHKNGFTQFEVDISNSVIVGENLLEVEVDNTLVPNCRWYTGSGIYRPVWLDVREKEHINKVFIDTVSYNPPQIMVKVQTNSQIKPTCEILDGDKVVYSGEIGLITIPNGKLWSAENPNLYTCKVIIPTDTELVEFGIRKIECNPSFGLKINGETVKLRGACIHQDNGVLGACTYEQAELRKIKILKEQGFNAIRVSHNPASNYLLKACDRLGMYILDEEFDGWYIPKEYHDYSRQFWDNFSDDLQKMVYNDYNHPSVIMYSIGNEITEVGEKRGIEFGAKMRDIIKEIDTSRPVTCGVNILICVYAKMGIGVYKDKGDYKPEPLPENKGYKEKKSGSAFFNAITNKLPWLFRFMSKGKMAEKIAKNFAGSIDVFGYNYGSSRYDKDAQKYPERLMLGTETMVCDLPYNWERVQKYPQLLGDFVWAGMDYLGEACIGDWTYYSYKGLPLLAGQGMIDLTGKPLAQMAYMQVVWGMRKTPFIGVRPVNHAYETPSTGAWQFTNSIDSWSWRGYENQKAVVEVYSVGSKVELYLTTDKGEKKIGEKKLKNFKAIFNTKYQNGTIKAISYDNNGTKLGEHSLVTANNTQKITVKLSQSTLKVGEICFAEIEYTDDLGNLLPYVEENLHIDVAKDLTLLGFGSSLCKTNEVFNSHDHKLYRGRALAVFKGEKSGIFSVDFKCLNQTTIVDIKVE